MFLVLYQSGESSYEGDTPMFLHKLGSQGDTLMFLDIERLHFR